MRKLAQLSRRHLVWGSNGHTWLTPRAAAAQPRDSALALAGPHMRVEAHLAGPHVAAPHFQGRGGLQPSHSRKDGQKGPGRQRRCGFQGLRSVNVHELKL